MLNQWHSGRWAGWMTVAVVIVLAAGGGWAFAATTASSGAIHACASKHRGALRLARRCNTKERAISWNVQGIPGKNGTNGINGTNGTNGTNGANGTNGVKGTNGADGTARAYGLITDAGVLTRSKNATLASHALNSGIYCIRPATGINPSTTVLVVTPDFTDDSTGFGSNTRQAVAEWVSSSANCAAGQMEVITGVRIESGASPVNSVDLQHADEQFSFVIP